MDYIEEITGTPPTLDETVEEDTSSEQDESIETSAEQVEDIEQAEESTPDVDDTKAELAALKSELEKAEGRMIEKDRYINELRTQNNKKEKEEVVADEESPEFWDDPQKVVESTQQQVRELQAKIDENMFASRNPDYYDIVNIDDVNKAISVDKEFADQMNSSSNVFETAYTYLKTKQAETASVEAGNLEALREQIKEEVMAELNVKPKKDIPQSVSGIGSANGTTSEAPSDGFAAMFES